MMRRLFVLSLMAVAAPAAATVLVPATFADMVTGAQAIVHGRVIEVRAQPTFDRSTIASYVTVQVAQHLKGQFGPTVTFRVPGGQVGRYRRIVVGAPHFDEGDEVIVFLSARGPSIPYLFGLSQGVYRVARAADGLATVGPPIVPEGAARAVRGDPARRPVPLHTFTQHVRALLERAQ